MKINNKTDAYIYQIFYNAETSASLDSGFIPLDNTSNLHQDWMEFWIIRNFLQNHDINSEAWYGFLSPKFFLKTGLHSSQVMVLLDKYGEDCDVALFTHSWDLIAYYQNCFEQGEKLHPGLLKASQNFLNAYGIEFDLRNHVDAISRYAFSNYILGKKSYWDKWLKMADMFIDYCDNSSGFESSLLNAYTDYNKKSKDTFSYPMKIFVQERLPSIILADRKLKIANFDITKGRPAKISKVDIDALLRAQNMLKELYIHTNNKIYLDAFYEIRKDIFKDPVIFHQN